MGNAKKVLVVMFLAALGIYILIIVLSPDFFTGVLYKTYLIIQKSMLALAGK